MTFVVGGRGGFGGPPPEEIDLFDVISCILVHFGDGHYKNEFSLICRVWTSLPCMTYFMSFHQPLLSVLWVLF